MNVHISHDQTDMAEQHFKDPWDQIFKLLTDLGYDIRKLIVVKCCDDLSRGHQKCFSSS